MDVDDIIVKDPAVVRGLKPYKTTGTIADLRDDQYLKKLFATFDYERFHVKEGNSPSKYALNSFACSGKTCHEMDSSVVVVDKKRTGQIVLDILLWFITEERFRFRYSFGDKETFWLAFELAHVPIPSLLEDILHYMPVDNKPPEMLYVYGKALLDPYPEGIHEAPRTRWNNMFNTVPTHMTPRLPRTVLLEVGEEENVYSECLVDLGSTPLSETFTAPHFAEICRRTVTNHFLLLLMAKHALIVGASAGIGLAVARKLASMVDKLTLCSRRCPPGLIASIRAENPRLEVVYVRLDVSLLHEVRQFTTRHKDTKFDWIVITAGILSLNGRTETKEGLDVKMSTHYYGRFMLVLDLLDNLNRPGVRVLNVLGAGRGGAPHLDDLDLKKNYSIKQCADATTLYSDLMAQALSEHAPNASFMHIYPGFVNTGIFNRFPWYVRLPSKAFAVVAAHSPERCAEYLVATLTKPEFAVGWKLLGERGDPLPKTKYHTDKLKSIVWKHTLKTIDNVMKQ